MTVKEFQELIERIYFERDASRGVERTFMWFVEEVGELSRAIARGASAESASSNDGEDRGNLREEFADVFAWLATLASLSGVSLDEVAREKYGDGCPRCRELPCACP